MKLPRLSFTSHRDAKGYRIAGTVAPPKGRVDLKSILDVDMRDWISGRLGKPDEEGRVSGPWISGYIVGVSGKTKPVQLDQYPHAFTDFAAVKTPTDLVQFISKYGPLIKAKRQVIIDLLDEAQQLRECMQAKKQEPFYRHLDLKAHLIKDRKTGELEASITPSSLLDALWLQFQDAQANDAMFQRCLACNNLFATGGNSGRRPFAKFCSDEHRKHFNSLARSNAELRRRRK
jgi:hypothetical protein